ncbi:MAG TPA: hypothetical protein VNO43_10215 [Candidatus Eisenbacteria bacterium]|nr:hypothetical protein [Candidatus Eisenbacteria bacterium]
MEQFEGRIDRIESAESGIFILTIVVSPSPVNARGRGKPLYYRMELDPQNRSMTPIGNLQNAFDVYHRYEYDDNLNPALRRQWKTAFLADQIVSALFESSALNTWRSC